MDLIHKRSKLPPRAVPRTGRGPLLGRKRDLRPTSYKQYFDCSKDVTVASDVFRVYLSGFENVGKPLCFLLHGAGHSALTWALFTKALREICDCRIVAVDQRGHGGTFAEDETDFSIRTLCDDVAGVIAELCKDELQLPNVILVGHSMGGALAVHCAHRIQQSIPTLLGIVVIDVVEGTAMDALQSMKSILRSRPKSFKSLEAAIEWSVCSGMTRNMESAKVSMPGQLKNVETRKPATEDVDNFLEKPMVGDTSEPEKRSEVAHDDRISEEDEEQAEVATTTAKPEPVKHTSCESGYVWRINLENTEQFWKEWFDGLSELFLTASVSSKLLILAGVDRLDRTLTIGQMQGKFQTEILSRCGHVAQEDDPEKVAEIIATFLIRNRIAERC